MYVFILIIFLPVAASYNINPNEKVSALKMSSSSLNYQFFFFLSKIESFLSINLLIIGSIYTGVPFNGHFPT